MSSEIVFTVASGHSFVECEAVGGGVLSLEGEDRGEGDQPLDTFSRAKF
jgi:hypothetical protein